MDFDFFLKHQRSQNIIYKHFCQVKLWVYPLRGKYNYVYYDLQYFIRYTENSVQEI
jgi:hypothetical protein